ncbi:hypothetical protein RNJ44_00321 [Nakaseomyces bracarensis]|uniref:WW domain-containing protein n=1 Tax=Nakaseomyces bracarensis TaxID=273131 RepID=A0ABR4NTR2_9SACH
MKGQDIWKEYRAPDGRKYYYNARTKETTWTVPEYRSKPKRRDNVSEVKALYSFELMHSWQLVVFSDGTKRYRSGPSDDDYVDDLVDKSSQKLLGFIDQDRVNYLCNMLKKPRLDDDKCKQLYEEIRDDIEFIKADLVETELDPEEVKRPKLDEKKPVTTLLAGYSSSDSEEEEEIDTEEKPVELKKEEMKQEEEKVVKPDENTEVDTKSVMFELFEKHGLNKFSTWKSESRKINQDPLFFTVMDDNIREGYFEEWCEDNRIEGSDEHYEEEEEELEPTKFHYLSQLVANYDIKPDTIPQDIMRDKKLIKEYRIKDYTSKQDQKQFLTKMLAWYKHLSIEARKDMFEQYLSRQKLDHFQVEPQADVESQLLSLENKLHLPRTPQDFEYYAIDLRSKRDLIIAHLSRG